MLGWARMILPSLRLTTLRMGVVSVGVAEHEMVFDVRILRDEAGGFHVLSAATLSETFTSVEQAIAAAESPEPKADVRYAVRWREDLEVTAAERACPICAMPIHLSPRYPRQLCPACVMEAADDQGRLLAFGNLGLSGGFEARHRDDNTPYDRHECFVRGQRCRADEGKFGGIVVERSADD